MSTSKFLKMFLESKYPAGPVNADSGREEDAQLRLLKFVDSKPEFKKYYDEKAADSGDWKYKNIPKALFAHYAPLSYWQMFDNFQVEAGGKIKIWPAGTGDY